MADHRSANKRSRTTRKRGAKVPRAAKFGPGERPWIRSLDHQVALRILVLLTLSSLVCVPALNGGFIWDDGIFTSSEAINGWDGLRKIWSSAAENGLEVHYWPVTYTTYWIEHKLWGLDPLGYRAVNLALHAINSILVWRLLIAIKVPGAFLAAAIFAIHPVHIESTAWAMGRKDLLSALFFVLAALAWFHADTRRRLPMLLLALVLYATAILSKTTAVTLPAGLLIGQWFKHGRLTRADLVALAPFFALGAGMALWDTISANALASHPFPFSLLERATLAARALAVYVERIAVPIQLILIYPRWPVDAADPLGWLLALIGVGLLAATWWQRRRIGNGWFAGLAFYVATLAPVLGFVDFGYMRFTFAADRYQYIALIAPAALFGGALASLRPRLPERLRWASTAMAGCVVAILGVLAVSQAALFRNEVTLFSHVTALNPVARGAHQILAKATLAQGQPDEALRLARIAVENRGDDTGAHAVASLALYELGRDDEAIHHLEEVLRYKPQESDALYMLSRIAIRQARDEDAARFMKSYLELKPTDHQLRLDRAKALLRLEHLDEAHAEALEVLDRLPATIDPFDALHVAGRAAYGSGQLDMAANHYLRALNVRREAEILARLGQLRFDQGRHEDALVFFKEQVTIEPKNAQARVNIASTLASMGKLEDALKTIDEALAIDPDNAFARTIRNAIIDGLGSAN